MPLVTSDANAVLDSRFGAGAAAGTNAPASYAIALSTTAPNPDGTGVTEPTGGAYAAVVVPNDATHWPPAVARVKHNGQDVAFPKVTASWGVVTHFVIKDDPGGAVRAYGELDAPKTVDVDAEPVLSAGSILIYMP